MSGLEEIRKNNILMAAMGLNFVKPVFRLLAGQVPYDVPRYTIYGRDERRRQKKLRRILEKNDNSFVVIVRDDNAELEDILFIPSSKEIELAKP